MEEGVGTEAALYIVYLPLLHINCCSPKNCTYPHILLLKGHQINLSNHSMDKNRLLSVADLPRLVKTFFESIIIDIHPYRSENSQ